MFLEFFLTAMVIELTPGPNMAWLGLLGASRGVKVALIAVAGITLGLTLAATISALGVDVLISEKPWIFQLLRFVGFSYFLYLAWDAWHVLEKERKNHLNEPLYRYFTQGLLSNIFNPKAYIVYTTILPQFTYLSCDV